MIREIDTHHWSEFCQRLNREERGALLTIEVIAPDGAKTRNTGRLIFEEMKFDTSDPCSDILSVRARDSREITHVMVEPTHIALLETENRGTFNPVIIQAANGTTKLTFHPAIHEQLLEEAERGF